PLINALNKILNEAKNLDTLSKEDIVTSTKKVEELNKNISHTKKELKDIDEKISKADEDIGNLTK
ncbi:MAG: hypothetical protein ACP5GB_03540, partial [Candidatus Micrarchaeia archaeon]